MNTTHFKTLNSRLTSALFVSAFVATATAQNFTLHSFTIDGGGGGTSAAGTYSVQGTIGQPDAGTMSGGSYQLAGGFWTLATALQTPGAPMLKIVSVTGGVRVSWSSPSGGFVLQQNSDLNSTTWANVPGVPADDGTNKTVVITPATGHLYLRLQK